MVAIWIEDIKMSVIWMVPLFGYSDPGCTLLIYSSTFSTFFLLLLLCYCLDIQALGKHIEDEDSEAFTNEIKTYEATMRLDKWHNNLLLRIKKQLPDENELC